MTAFCHTKSQSDSNREVVDVHLLFIPMYSLKYVYGKENKIDMHAVAVK